MATAAFPGGTLDLRMRDEFDPIFTDAPSFATHRRPTEAPWRLALVTILPYAEGLSARQAVDAVCSRIDWKHALGVERTDPGFHSMVLYEFRALGSGSSRIAAPGGPTRVLSQPLTAQEPWPAADDATHVLGAIRAVNRLVCVAETLRHALNSLAVAVPEWWRAHGRPEWLEHDGPRVHNDCVPKGEQSPQAYAQMVGLDGDALPEAIDACAEIPT